MCFPILCHAVRRGNQHDSHEYDDLQNWRDMSHESLLLPMPITLDQCENTVNRQFRGTWFKRNRPLHSSCVELDSVCLFVSFNDCFISSMIRTSCSK